MTYQIDLSAFLMDNIQVIIITMIVLILLALIVFININIKLAKMNKRYRKMMTGMEGANLEGLLMTHIQEVREALVKVEDTANACKKNQDSLQHCVQKIGIVRFNAFEDTGSDLSFALALLDEKDNGVVISTIYGRNESRTYAKPVVNRQSEYFLTEEEKEALTQAWNKKH
ncbi:MAG: DUF4446 family protein [Pelosinus sp.]|nr:DUF4446 family protein [Pelosinus sp.]